MPGQAAVALRWAAAAVLAAGVLAPATPAGADVTTPVRARVAASGACAGSSGVTVVVDFGALGGGIQVRCAGDGPGTGLDALSRAGFSYGFVPNKGPFVCTIAGRPDPCNGAPTDAYWSYWAAPRGGSWAYNSTGAHLLRPGPGAVEGWAFGAGTRPSVAPPPPATTTTRPPAATGPPNAGSPNAGSPNTGPPNTGSPNTATPAPTPAPPAPGPTEPEDGPPAETTTSGPGDDAPADPSEDGTSDGGRTGTAGDDDRRRTATTVADDGRDDDGDGTDDELAAEPTSSSGGSGAGTVLALVVAAAVTGSAVWELRRRRSPS